MHHPLKKESKRQKRSVLISVLLLYRVDIVRSPLGSDSVFMTFHAQCSNPQGSWLQCYYKDSSPFLYILPIFV